MEPRDQSILTQVAFKGAVELFGLGQRLTSDEDRALFIEMFTFLSEALKSEVAHNISSPAAAAAGDAGAGAVTVVDGITFHGLTGPVPAWIVPAAKEAGVTALRDNRQAQAGNPRQPAFIAADGTKQGRFDMGFWETPKTK